MSLEEAVKENTEAITKLTESLDTFNPYVTSVDTFNPTEDTSKPETEVSVNMPSTRKKRRTKAQIAADKETAEKSKTQTSLDLLDDIPDASATPVETITLDQLRAEASAVVELDSHEGQKGLTIAQDIIREAGVTKISDIPEGKRPEVISKFREAVKAWKK